MSLAMLVCLAQIAQAGPLPTGRDVWGMALSPDGGTLAISHRSDRLSVLDMGARKVGAAVPQAGPEGSMLAELSYSPDGKALVAGNANEHGANPVWDAQTWKTRVHFGMRSSVDSIEPSSKAAFSGDGRFVFAQHLLSGSLAAFDPTSGTPSYQMVPNARYPLMAWDAAPLDAFVAFLQEGLPTVQIWAPTPTAASDRWGERSLSSLSIPDKVRLLRFSPDGRALALIGRDGESRVLVVVSLEPDAKRVIVPLEDLDARAVAWFPDSKRLVAGGLYGKIAVVDVEEGRVLRTWVGHEERHVRAIVVAPDGQLLTGAAGEYSEKEGGQITWWAVETGEALRSVAID